MKQLLDDPLIQGMARSAVLLQTMVLSADGAHFAHLGTFLHTPEHPFRDTLDADGARAPIHGAAPFEWREMGEGLEMIEVTVERREKQPLCGTLITRVYDLDEGGWVTLHRLKRGARIRIPETSPAGLVVTYGRVTKIRSATVLPDRLWLGTPELCGTLRLRRGSYSYATPSAFVHV